MEVLKTVQGNTMHVLSPSRPTLLTVQQFAQAHPAFTHGGLRWLLFHRQQNGLERAVVKVGRKVLIDVDQFFLWLAQQNGR
jgi:hypothetical protein